MEVAIVGSVVGAAAGAIIKVLLKDLGEFVLKQIKLIRDSKKDLMKLRETLITIQKFVYDAETKQSSDTAVKDWLKKLEDVAFEAYNVLDEVHYYSLRKETHYTTPLKVHAKSFFSVPKSLNWGHRIRDINKDFESINAQTTGLGLQIILAALPATATATPETDSITSDPVFLGRDDDVMKIVGMIEKLPTEQVFSILPVVGMGGMGKSTLVREVMKKQTPFGTRIWVHVSPNFDPKTLFKKILERLTLEKVKVKERESVLTKLQQALANRKYLLVLDDVWNEDKPKWEEFKNALSGVSSTKGNGIIVTTRKSSVASIVATLPTHELQGLSKDNCWSIIKAKAFEEKDIIPPAFETPGLNIAERCQGLPLAANVVGGVLRGKSSDEWVSIQDSWLSDHVEGDFISKILKLSFDNLPSPWLKKCFAYCSIFPKGERIEREELIKLWMGEGFLQPLERSDMETVGNKNFSILLQSSLLLVADRDEYNNVTHCSMHDLVHDVACSVLGFPKENGSILDGLYRARYIGYESHGGESSSILPKEKAKYVRTLFYNGGISDGMFSDFKSLHVLTLSGYNVKDLPSSVMELMHLRCLNISYTSIERLPDTIAELHHLETFRAYSLHLSELPSTLKYLTGLRHLHVLDQTKLPGELGMLTSLQTLPYFEVGEEKGHQIMELGSLKCLKGMLKIYNLEKVKDKEEAKSARIFEKPNIVKLVLKWNGSSVGCEGVLEGLQPHPNLKSLEIVGFNGAKFPLWALKMGVPYELQWKGLDKLVDIRLKDCSECVEIPMMGQLPHLKSLYLSGLTKVTAISSSFYNIDNVGVFNNTIVVFPSLRLLRLHDMPNMTEWMEVPRSAQNQQLEVKVFPCLEQLEISNCKQLRSAPTQFPCLKELDICQVDSGLPLANICGVNLASLTKLKITEVHELVSLPHILFSNNPNLSEVEITECTKLTELPDGLHNLNSLHTITILSCPTLKLIPYSSSGSSTSLCRLSIEACKELTNMQMIVDCLHKMPRLTELAITGVRKFILSSTPTFSSLQDLKMGGGHVSWDCNSFKEVVDGILLVASQSLGRLHLIGMDGWDSLPDQIQHLAAVSKLQLDGFGVQELPDSLGNISSLEELSVYYCKRLRSLPSVDAMRRLTKLSHLDIYGCELLKRRLMNKQSSYSEWHKISHLPDLYLDGSWVSKN